MRTLSSSRSLPTMTAPSIPALSQMVRAGMTMAFSTMLIPIFWSTLEVCSMSSLRPLEAWRRAEPPPATMPAVVAALVAARASMVRSFFSPTSASLAPPTLITAIPPEILARRSWSFSFSYSEVVLAMEAWRSSTRSSISALLPAPSRTMVSSLETVTFLASPSMSSSAFSSLRPTSWEMTWPPVRMARSWRLALRFSPKPGALTAQTLRPPRSLLTTRVARASPSTSSATMRRGRLSLTVCSRMGTRD
mmetsp:Transcript_16446/g.31937  ORF Transcript_16446/g.31937 Transcript_16446/m.31937 type:complete len:249 (+) Transcript_16446:690-1436(+)